MKTLKKNFQCLICDPFDEEEVASVCLAIRSSHRRNCQRSHHHLQKCYRFFKIKDSAFNCMLWWVYILGKKKSILYHFSHQFGWGLYYIFQNIYNEHKDALRNTFLGSLGAIHKCWSLRLIIFEFQKTIYISSKF